MRQKQLVLNMLREFIWPQTKYRFNVMREGQTGYEGFVLGLVKPRHMSGRKVPSNKTLRPKYKQLFIETKKLMKQKDLGFRFTSIQFNKNHRAVKHKDAKNMGVSYIIGLGDYTGGDLIVYDKDGKNPVYHNIKNRFYKFDGSKLPHETAPFKGERYTIVFYSI